MNWYKSQSGNRYDRIKKAIESTGATVIEYENRSSFDIDFVYSSIPNRSFDEFTYSHLGGYGTLINPRGYMSEKYKMMLKESDVLLMLDPLLYLESFRQADLPDRILDKIVICPLGKPQVNRDVDAEIDTDKFIVFNPMGDWDIKRIDEFIKTVRIVNDRMGDKIHFLQTTKNGGIYNNRLEWLNIDNLTLLPEMSYEDMMKIYKVSDLVTPWSNCEVFSNTAMESFSFGKPTILRTFSKILSIDKEYLDDLQSSYFSNVKDFHERFKDLYETGKGEHYLATDDYTELADMIIDVYKNYEDYQYIGKNAKKWMDNFWTKKEKFESLQSHYRYKIANLDTLEADNVII